MKRAFQIHRRQKSGWVSAPSWGCALYYKALDRASRETLPRALMGTYVKFKERGDGGGSLPSLKEINDLGELGTRGREPGVEIEEL